MSIVYASNILERPNHLNLEFLQDVLENALYITDFYIKSAVFTMGSNVGENYCSQIYRVKIAYELKTDQQSIKEISIIIKSIPLIDGIEFLVDLNVYHKECIFYNYVLPRMEMLLTGRNTKFGPRLYMNLKKPIQTLAFEDLTKLKYELASREKGLDEFHARLVMKKLGEFHAASIALFKKMPEFKSCFKSGMISELSLERDNNTLLRYFGGNLTALIELIENWPNYEEITKKIKKYAVNFKENLLRGSFSSPNDFKVLNHGDLWVNNMLFQYNELREPIDINLVDFQMSVWSSPGIDLNYFFYTSLELNVLQDEYENLIREYYQSLSHSLRKLNHLASPTYQQIRHEVRKHALYGFFANYGVFPTISMEKQYSNDNSLESFQNEEFAQQKLKQMFSSKRLETTMRYTLKQFDQMGILD
uniref:CHK domain-containing protein n=1 Tax=Glossina brevipalpis TaxID=37001 RepID=A0A1A9WZ79_9MUSC